MTLLELVDVPDEQRDPAWEHRFFHALSLGNLKVAQPQPQPGPDGWPYLLCETGGLREGHAEGLPHAGQRKLHRLAAGAFAGRRLSAARENLWTIR